MASTRYTTASTCGKYDDHSLRAAWAGAGVAASGTEASGKCTLASVAPTAQRGPASVSARVRAHAPVSWPPRSNALKRTLPMTSSSWPADAHGTQAGRSGGRWGEGGWASDATDAETMATHGAMQVMRLGLCRLGESAHRWDDAARRGCSPGCVVGWCTESLSCVSMCISVVLPALSRPRNRILAFFWYSPARAGRERGAGAWRARVKRRAGEQDRLIANTARGDPAQVPSEHGGQEIAVQCVCAFAERATGRHHGSPTWHHSDPPAPGIGATGDARKRAQRACSPRYDSAA